MGIDGLVVLRVNLFLEIFEHIECNIVGIRLDGIGEEFDLELNVKVLNELQWKSESSWEDENFDNFISFDILGMCLQELEHILVWEDDLGVKGVLVSSLTQNKHGYKIDKSNRSLLVFINLCTFDSDKFITNIFPDLEHAIGGKNMSDHVVIMGSQKLKKIVSKEVEVWVSADW